MKKEKKKRKSADERDQIKNMKDREGKGEKEQRKEDRQKEKVEEKEARKKRGEDRKREKINVNVNVKREKVGEKEAKEKRREDRKEKKDEEKEVKKIEKQKKTGEVENKRLKISEANSYSLKKRIPYITGLYTTGLSKFVGSDHSFSTKVKLLGVVNKNLEAVQVFSDSYLYLKGFQSLGLMNDLIITPDMLLSI